MKGNPRGLSECETEGCAESWGHDGDHLDWWGNVLEGEE